MAADSPYDPDARYGNKRSTTWSGYKAHFTETCDADCPHFVVHVETTPAPVSDVAMTAPVHEALRAKDLLPGTHLVDAGYVDADLLIDAQAAHGIELVGPVRPDTSWQAQAGQGYAISAFAVDWEAKTVTCPQGHRSVDWAVNHDPWGTGTVHVGFANAACRACPSRPLCTRAKAAPRALTLRREGRHEAIQAMRKRQDTPEWRALYGARADHQIARPLRRAHARMVVRGVAVNYTDARFSWSTWKACCRWLRCKFYRHRFDTIKIRKIKAALGLRAPPAENVLCCSVKYSDIRVA
jgi:transposase